ncbi:MAG: hypothetical protein IPK82_09910 [Polyangiaceae bacterium]|nr:hypothetical protein [Polyangiaceae bacterium]
MRVARFFTFLPLGLTLLVGCTQPPAPPLIPVADDPIEFGGPKITFKPFSQLEQQMIAGVDYSGDTPPLDVAGHALNSTYVVSVICAPQPPVIKPNPNRRYGDRAYGPLVDLWAKTSQKEPLVLVLNRQTSHLTTLHLPSSESLNPDIQAAVQLQGTRAVVAWLSANTPNKPSIGGQGEIDLETGTWVQAKSAVLPAPPVPEVIVAPNSVHLVANTPIVQIRQISYPEIGATYTNQFNKDTSSWSQWVEAPTPFTQQIQTISTSPFVFGSANPPKRGTRSIAALWRVDHKGASSIPISIGNLADAQQLSPSLLYIRDIATADTPQSYLVNLQTLTIQKLSQTHFSPWKSGLSVYEWSAYGEQAIVVSTLDDGQLVGRIFEIGKQDPIATIPAPPDALAQLKDWVQPHIVRFHNGICLLGGLTGKRWVAAGLCFDAENRRFRVVDTQPPQSLPSDSSRCMSPMPREDTPSTHGCYHSHFLSQYMHSERDPPRWSAKLWEMVGFEPVR